MNENSLPEHSHSKIFAIKLMLIYSEYKDLGCYLFYQVHSYGPPGSQ